MKSGYDEKMSVWDVLKLPLRFLRRYWWILIAVALLAILAGFLCIRLWHNRDLLIAGGVMVVLSIVFAIAFFVRWVTMRYNIRQKLIATYGRECCTPTPEDGTGDASPVS